MQAVLASSGGLAETVRTIDPAPDMLLSIHIPKTAGTAWRLYLEDNLGSRAGFVSPEARDADQVGSRALALTEAGDTDAARTLVEAAGCGLIAGHRALELIDLWPEAGAMAWLRDPVDRLVSEYLHFRSRPQPMAVAQQIARGEMGIETYAGQHYRYYTQIETRLKARSGPYCFFLTDHADAALAACREVAGWQGRLPARNVTPRAQFDGLGDPQTLRARLTPHLQEEIEVHARWREAWQNGNARNAARTTLAHAPRPVSPGLALRLRRQLGIAKEKLGHALGRDWR